MGTLLSLQYKSGALPWTTLQVVAATRALAVQGTAWLWLGALPDEDVDFPICDLLTGG